MLCSQYGLVWSDHLQGTAIRGEMLKAASLTQPELMRHYLYLLGGRIEMLAIVHAAAADLPYNVST